MAKIKTFPELKKISLSIAEKFKIEYNDAAKIVAYYSGRSDWGGVDRVAAFDMEYVTRAAAAVGVVLPASGKKEVKQTSKARKAGGDGSKNDLQGNTGTKTQTKQKNTNKEGKKAEKENISLYKNINGGGACDTPGMLPADLLTTLECIVNEYCVKNELENMRKAAGLQWGAACMLIGQYIKNNGILYDKERTIKRGGRGVYDVEKVNKLIDIWVFMCQSYAKIPLVTDFMYFSGVSDGWLYSNNGNNSESLTSSGSEITKKLSKIQASALASGIVDGRENPTGKIYFTKAVLGWSDTGGGLIQAEKPKNNPDALPVFDSSGALDG